MEESAIHRRDNEGKAIQTFGAVRDITQEKIQEKELKNQLSLTDKHIIISTTDVNGKILHASEAFCKISGFTLEELLGKNHRIVRHPDMPQSLYENMW